MSRAVLRTVVAWIVISIPACATDGSDVASTSQAIVDPSAFVLPPSAAADRAQIVHRYDALDPGDAIPRGLLEDAIEFFDLNQPLIPKTQFFVVVDLSQYSGHNRFWLVDLSSGAVESHKVAHGAGSDPDNDGYATLFSNVPGSNMSSLGYYLTGEIYDGTHPHSMRIDGLSADGSPNQMANTNVRERYVVVHEAWYVSDSNTGQQGRSDGCFALDPAIELGVVDRIHDGTLIYAEIASLNPPVGRAVCGDGVCDGAETSASCPADCGNGSGSGGDGGSGAADGGGGGASASKSGGCSASGNGAGLALALGLLAFRRRARRLLC
jgi:hypothetical protein